MHRLRDVVVRHVVLVAVDRRQDEQVHGSEAGQRRLDPLRRGQLEPDRGDGAAERGRYVLGPFGVPAADHDIVTR
jgi:hypothetical protein